MTLAQGRSGKSPLLPAQKTEYFEIGEGKRMNPEGFFNLDVYPVRFRRTHGRQGEMGPFEELEVFERGDAVGVLLYDREEGNVVLVRQFRLPTLDLAPLDDPDQPKTRADDEPAPRNGWIIEAVAGMVGTTDKHGPLRTETPEETAIRETWEETGYDIEKPELIATFFSSPGGTSERIFLYFALVSDKRKSGLGGGKREADGRQKEDIEVLALSVSTFSKMVGERTIVDPKLLIAAYYLQARLGLRIDTDRRLEPVDQPPTLFRWKKRAASPSASGPATS